MCSNMGSASVPAKGSDFASFSPTALSGKKERVITLTKDGDYIYSRSIPSFSDAKIDTNSTQYKRALSDYNIKVKFNSDGSATVSSGGLFSRKQNFKTAKDFQSEANKRIDKQKSYWESEESRIKSGRLTQLEAESIKSDVIKKSKSMAIKNINNSFKERISEAKTYIAAADDMKRRLSIAIDKARR